MLLAIINCPACSDEPDVVVVQDLRHLERVLLRRAEYNGYGHTAVIHWESDLDAIITHRESSVCNIRYFEGDEGEFVTIVPMVPGKTVPMRRCGCDYYCETVD